MSEQDNRGVMFVNTEKTEDTHYDLEGFAKVNNVDVWVNGWVRKSKEPGKPDYWALRFKNKPTTK